MNALLLESAQAIDETENAASNSETVMHRKNMWRLSAMTREGVDWVVALPQTGEAESCGTQATGEVADLIRCANEACKRLSEQLDAGPLSHLEGRTLDRRLLLLPWDNRSFLTSWPIDSDANRLLDQTKKIVASWDS